MKPKQPKWSDIKWKSASTVIEMKSRELVDWSAKNNYHRRANNTQYAVAKVRYGLDA
jgi:hypothetical protein